VKSVNLVGPPSAQRLGSRDFLGVIWLSPSNSPHPHPMSPYLPRKVMRGAAILGNSHGKAQAHSKTKFYFVQNKIKVKTKEKTFPHSVHNCEREGYNTAWREEQEGAAQTHTWVRERVTTLCLFTTVVDVAAPGQTKVVTLIVDNHLIFEFTPHPHPVS
jgi:hypothetical protein